MSKINAEWHKTNRMPKNPTFNERVFWHLEHIKNCECRKIPKKFATLMDDAGVRYPKDKVDI
jgi:hypothetical protein